MKALKFILFIFLFFLCAEQNLKAQNFYGIPYLHYYSSDDYSAAGRNWAVIQDRRGIMYFANNQGILEFDGIHWNIIYTKNKTVVRSFAQDAKGKIYVGASGDFGYLAPNSKGKMEFISLLEKIPEKERNFTDVWDIFITPKGVAFATFEALYILEEAEVKIIRPKKTSFHKIFYVNNKFYLREWGVGLQSLSPEGKLELVPEGDKFEQERIYVMLPFGKEKILLVTRTQGAFIFDGKKIESFKTSIDQELIEGHIYCALKLPNNLYLLGTYQNGLFIINQSGEEILHLNKETGLGDNTIHYAYLDQAKNLWVALGKGIAYIELNAPFSIIDARQGLSGLPNAIAQNKEDITVATSFEVQQIKLIKEKNRSNLEINTIKNSKNYNSVVKAIDDRFFIGNLDGLFELKNGNFKNIYNASVVNDILPLPSNKNIILVGTKDGLVIIRRVGEEWKFDKKVNDFNVRIDKIAEDAQGNIWLSDEAHGLYLLSFDKDFEKIRKKQFFTEKNGLPSNSLNFPFCLENQLLIATQKGIYSFAKGNFYPVDRFNKDLDKLEQKNVSFIKKDSEGNIWLIVGNRLAVFYKTKGGYRFERQKFQKLKEVNDILFLNKSELFFLTPNGIVCYQKNQEKTEIQNFRAVIRSVKEDLSGNDSIFFAGTFLNDKGELVLNQAENQIPKLSYQLNSIRIEYASNFYADADKIVYQYYLEGFEESWSDWTNNSIKEYTNLREGTYIFHVRAMNMYGEISQEATYTFIVMPPAQRTIWAYLSYILFALLVIFTVIRLNKWLITRQRKKLEEKIDIRTKELQKEKQRSEANATILLKTKSKLEGSLKKSKENNEKLQAQEEELRQNMEELQATQEEIERTQAELISQLNAINNSPIAKAEISLEGEILTANKSFMNLFGIEENFLKQNKHLLFEELAQESPEKLEKFIADLKDNKLPSQEYFREKENGEIIWVNSTFFPARNKLGEVEKIIQLSIDITATKKQTKELEKRSELIERQNIEIEFALKEQTEKNEELKAQEEEMRQNMEELLSMQEQMQQAKIELEGQMQAIDNSTIAKAEFSIDGYILKANNTFCKLFKYSPEQIIGLHHKILLESRYADSFEYEFFWEVLKKGSPQPGEYKRIDKNGEEFWLNTIYSPVKDGKGKVNKIIKLGFDVTETKNLLKELEQQTEIMRAQEEEMRQNMEELIATQDAMEIKQQKLEESQKQIEERNKKLKSNEEVLRKSFDTLQAQKEELGKSNEKLKIQEEELRQNMEELRNTQAAMLKKQEEVEQAKEALEKQNTKLSSNETILKKAFQKMKDQEEQLRINYEELQAQEEEIRQNMEELQATQEALKQQNKKIASKNRLITASINYAQNIQQAILPNQENLKEVFHDSFILFEPKDIVSGDFYWLTLLQGKIFIAVVDCTGHGVPGAFMSVIGNSLLNDITGTQSILEPNHILEQLHLGIRNRLKQEKTENHDGMDVCLCSIDYANPKKIEINFAGAKRPIYYIEQKDKVLKVLRGDRKSIGGWQHEEYRDFSKQSIFLKRGDKLYLSSDGFVDNPNEDRKKFGEKDFKALILAYQDKPMKEQQELFKKALRNHQGRAEQRDDITLLGITL